MIFNNEEVLNPVVWLEYLKQRHSPVYDPL